MQLQPPDFLKRSTIHIGEKTVISTNDVGANWISACITIEFDS